jgi:phosphoribosyl-AMP cyclohydrolase
MLDPRPRRRRPIGAGENAFAPGWGAVNNGRVTDQPAPSSPAPAPAPTPSRSALDPAVAALLKRDDAGLVAAVVQDEASRDVLMVGWMDDEALHRTLTTGRSTFWSRSRGEYWAKGDTSGHRQWVREVRLDCDGDTLLVTVQQEGAACHTGDRTCFDARVLPAVVGAPATTAVTTAPGAGPRLVVGA